MKVIDLNALRIFYTKIKTDILTLVPVFKGPSGNKEGESGLVPAPPINLGQVCFLRDNGNWQELPSATTDTKGCVKAAANITDVVNESDLLNAFNALLESLRNAGILKTKISS